MGSGSYQRLWKNSIVQIIISMFGIGLGIADIIIKCPICKQADYIPAACYALPIWTPVLMIGTAALGLMTGPESKKCDKMLRWYLVLSFLSVAVCLVVIGWSVTNIVQSVSSGLLSSIGMQSIALAVLIIITGLMEICFFVASSVCTIDLLDKVPKAVKEEAIAALCQTVMASSKKTRKPEKERRWIFSNNATLINLPKIAVPMASKSSEDVSKVEMRSKRKTTVMELMRSHFESNKNLLLPADIATIVNQKSQQTPAELTNYTPSGEYDNVKHKKYIQSESGEYDNVVFNSDKIYSDPIVSAKENFQAIRAMFNNTDNIATSLPNLQQIYPNERTVAEINIIPNTHHQFQVTPSTSSQDVQSSTVPKYHKRKLPPTPQDLVIQNKVTNLGQVSYIVNSIDRR